MINMDLTNCFLFLTGLVLATAYDDLSKDKIATQSSTAPSVTDVSAGKAVDRDTKTCMKTNIINNNSPDSTVWWQVDLGDVYSVYSVSILFKNYEGQEMRQQGRFAGFSLFVSDNGVMDNTSLCYKDGPQLPPLNFTTTCITSGRYVTFYNERLHEVVYPEEYELAVYTELCEVIVQGCQTTGVYGNSCKERCPTNCKDNVCHIQKGTCFTCAPGWAGTTCDTQCSKGWYGLYGEQQCSGHCRDNSVCNHVTGQCDEGCVAGWFGVLCKKECDNGTYGNNCVNNCSGNCLNDSNCNKQNGQCDMGCKPGYTNALCNKRCLSGYFGNKCKQSCSRHCWINLVCDHIDGTCTDGCEAGYMDKLCNTSCSDGYYGKNCINVCSPNCRTCKHTDGTCSCFAGWRGPNCTIVCNKSYGEDCQYPCSPHCINQTCDPFNGTCLTSCTDKSYGDKCIAEIRNTVSNSIPEAIGGTLGACVILIVSAALFLIRRKRLHVSGTTGSLYTEIEIPQSEDSTYQQLNVLELETDNANQQLNISELEPNKTYQQLSVSELETGSAYQQLNIT